MEGGGRDGGCAWLTCGGGGGAPGGSVREEGALGQAGILGGRSNSRLLLRRRASQSLLARARLMCRNFRSSSPTRRRSASAARSRRQQRPHHGELVSVAGQPRPRSHSPMTLLQLGLDLRQGIATARASATAHRPACVTRGLPRGRPAALPVFRIAPRKLAELCSAARVSSAMLFLLCLASAARYLYDVIRSLPSASSHAAAAAVVACFMVDACRAVAVHLLDVATGEARDGSRTLRAGTSTGVLVVVWGHGGAGLVGDQSTAGRKCRG